MTDLLAQLDLLAEKREHARPNTPDFCAYDLGLGEALVNHWPEIRRVIEAAREADEVISAYVLDRRERDALRMQDVSPKLHAALRELTRDAALEDDPER